MTTLLKNSLKLLEPGRWLVVLTLWVAPRCAAEAPDVHPLLPGLRSSELNNPAWPRTLHDELASGFSPLACGMSTAPEVWSRHDFGGHANWYRTLPQRGRADRLLVCDRMLRLVGADGTVLWTSPTTGHLAFVGDLSVSNSDAPGDGPSALVLTAGNRLTILDADTGRERWTHRFDPPHVEVLPVFDDILPDVPGLEAAYALQHGEDGGLINFPPDGEPQILWQGKLVEPGEYDERYDHYCSLRVDVSDPGRPVLWNVRRYRCRGFDARTGKMLSSLAYSIGGEQRRNYGPWAMGRGKGGQPLAIVTADRVQIHAHAIRLHRDRPNELAWQQYYGEVYKDAFGVALENLAIADLDGDGETEVAYSVRDPQRGFRSFVVVRDADSGAVEWELPDHWGVAAFSGLGGEKSEVLAVLAAPGGTMPTRGDMHIYQFHGQGAPRLAGTVRRAQTWGLPIVNVEGRDLMLLRTVDGDGNSQVALFDIVAGELKGVAHTSAASLLRAPFEAVMNDGGGDLASQTLVSEIEGGRASAVRWDGSSRWTLPVDGGAVATLSAADIDGDGRAELAAITPGKQLQILSFDDEGVARTRAVYQCAGRWNHHSPLLYDLTADGRYDVITPEVGDEGQLVVSAYRGDGSAIWKASLDARAEGLDSFVAHAGKFLPEERSAVVVSLHDSRSTRDGLHLLDGATGKILWSKSIYHDGTASMPYRIHGAPTAFDYDRDGTPDIGIDMLSYMAFLRGVDGSFAFVRHSPNIRSENALYAGHLYNTFVPVFQSAADERPHWFVNGGYGAFGVMNPDVVTGRWRVNLGYDGPPNVGLVDVDGDGSLEVGYAAYHSRKFVCRDFWTGDVKWELDLPHAPNSSSITANVDGLGGGEFLTGSFCIGVDAAGEPAVRWRSPTPLGWAIIADFDGDGRGEIACPRAGGITVLKAAK